MGRYASGTITDVSALATQATLAVLNAKIPAAPATEGGNLASIAAEDFATQTTLALIKTKTDNLDALLSTLATQATLALIKTKTDNLDALLSTLATQATLALIKTQTDNLDTALSGVKTGTDKINTIAKTIQAELLAITAVLANAQQKSSELALTNVKQATIFIDHARDAAAAFVGAGTEYRIEVSEKAAGDDTWRALYSVVCDITAASSIVMDAEEAAGQTLIEIGATTPAVGDFVFFKNATLANSEWGKVVAINAGVTFTLLDGLTNTQPAITLFNKAEHFVIVLDTTAYTRLRVVVNNNNGSTNQNIVSRIAAITSV